MSRALTAVAAGALLVVPLALVAPGQADAPAGAPVAYAPAAYAETTPCQAAPPRPEDPRLYAEDRGRLPGLLDLDEVHRHANGSGIGVAVVDTGVADNGRVANLVQGGAATGVRGGVQDTHGTLVAGLIAGTDRDGKAFGVAPAARIVSVKAADAGKEVAASSQEDLAQVTDDRMAEAIRTATSLRRTQGVRVINLSLNLPEDDAAVTAAIREATAKGILVVAAVGNRTMNEDDEPDPKWRPGEDTVAFPATVEGVLGVTALGAAESLDPNTVWTGRAVDVSAPLDGVISTTTNGGTCLVGGGSSFAAAIVSGVAALLFEEYPHDSPAQIATRIMATAQGAMEDDALDGHGMVQPDEALTAALDISRSGELVRAEAYAPPEQKATPPPLPEDQSAGTRATLLWWGVGAGGLLLAALLVRPLTRRRA
jgi:membrane-anchored mycosin MYCP